MEPDRELIFEDARSIREGLWGMARLAQDAAETPNLAPVLVEEDVRWVGH